MSHPPAHFGSVRYAFAGAMLALAIPSQHAASAHDPATRPVEPRFVMSAAQTHVSPTSRERAPNARRPGSSTGVLIPVAPGTASAGKEPIAPAAPSTETIRFDYAYAGRIGLRGGEPDSVLLVKGTDTRLASAGQALDDFYFVEAITSDRIDLRHTPSGHRFSRSFSELAAGPPTAPQASAAPDGTHRWVSQHFPAPPTPSPAPPPPARSADPGAGPTDRAAASATPDAPQPAVSGAAPPPAPSTPPGHFVPPPSNAPAAPESMRPVDRNATGVPGAFVAIPPPPPNLFPPGILPSAPPTNILRHPADVGGGRR